MRSQEEPTWNFLSSRDPYVLHLAIVFWRVSAFIQGKLAGNLIQVPHQQQRLFLSISLEAGDQVSPSGSGLINLRLNALCRQHSFNVFSRAGLVSRRVAGVDLYQFHKELQSFIMGFVEIRSGLL